MTKKNLRFKSYSTIINCLSNIDTEEIFCSKIAGKNELSTEDTDYLKMIFQFASSAFAKFVQTGERKISIIPNASTLTEEEFEYIDTICARAYDIYSRRIARDYTYKLIFSYLFNEEMDTELRLQIESDKFLTEDDKIYVDTSFNNVAENRYFVEQMIEKYAIGFPLDRIFKPDLAILLYAVSEMKYNNEIPDEVAISEAIAIVKKYSTAKSGQFVNGILASIYKELN